MTLRTMPDAERLLSAFLRLQPEVVDLVAQRVYTVLPDTKEWPLVRLQRIGGTSEGTPNDDALLRDVPAVQVDVYGGAKALAWQVADTVRAAIQERARGAHPTGWVERVTLGAARYVPDPTFDPARPRVVFDVTMYLRPAGDYPNP